MSNIKQRSRMHHPVAAYGECVEVTIKRSGDDIRAQERRFLLYEDALGRVVDEIFEDATK